LPNSPNRHRPPQSNPHSPPSKQHFRASENSHG
jgi:hypothetical protein